MGLEKVSEWRMLVTSKWGPITFVIYWRPMVGQKDQCLRENEESVKGMKIRLIKARLELYSEIDNKSGNSREMIETFF